jgi:hypothetical protein
MLNGPSTGRYNTVYTKNLKLHRGVDNNIQFQLLNQDEKPINITGKTINFRLLSTKSKVLLRKALTPSLSLNGIANLELPKGLLESIPAQVCNYSLTIAESDNEQPIYTGKDSDVRGTIEVVDGILPKFSSSTNVSLASRPFLTPAMNLDFYSSAISLDKNSHTVQIQFENFSGMVYLQGSTSLDSADWYNIQGGPLIEYNNLTNIYHYNFRGFHPYFRIKFSRWGGDVSNIYLR